MARKKLSEDWRAKMAKMFKQKGVAEYFREMGRIGGERGGAAGGKLAAARMTPEERRERARKGGLAGGRGRPKKAKARKKG